MGAPLPAENVPAPVAGAARTDRDDDGPQQAGTARRVATNTGALAVAELLGKVASFVLALVCARMLSKDDFGALAFALSFGTLLTIVPTWGFSAILEQRGTVHPERVNRYLAEILVWQVLMSAPIVVLAIAGGFAWSSAVYLGATLALMVLWAFGDVFFTTLRSAAASRRRLVGVSAALAVQRLLTMVLGVAVLLAGYGVVAVGAAYLIGSLVSLVIAWRATARLGLRPDFRAVHRSGLVRVLKRAAPLALGSIVAMALFRADTIIIKFLLGDAAVADYTVAYRLFETGLFLAWSINASIMPEMSAEVTRPQRVRDLGERAIGALAAVYVPLGALFVVRGHDLIVLLFGEQYAGSDSTRALQLLAFAPLAWGCAFLLVSLLVAFERPLPTLWSSLAALTFNLTANVVLVPRYGIAAAAAVNTVSYVIQAAVLYLCAVPFVGPLRLVRVLTPAAAGAAVFAAICWIWPAHVLVVTAVGLVAFAGVWFTLTHFMDPETAEFLKGALRRVRLLPR